MQQGVKIENCQYQKYICFYNKEMNSQVQMINWFFIIYETALTVSMKTAEMEVAY